MFDTFPEPIYIQVKYMRKLAIFVLLALQSFAYAGTVCGAHLTAAESMACCIKAHVNANTPAMSDSDADSCCSSCGTSKTQAIKRQDILTPHDEGVVLFTSAHGISSVTVSEPSLLKWNFQKFTSSDPPEILLTTQSLRI